MSDPKTLTPDALRAEAEKVALKFVAEWWRYAANVSLLTDALLAFAQQHAAQAVKRARLEARWTEACFAVGVLKGIGSRTTVQFFSLHADKLQAELAALERGDKEADAP